MGAITGLFTHQVSSANVDGTATALYADAIAGGTLAAPGDSLEFEYHGYTAGTTNNRRVWVYFGGFKLFDSQSMTFGLGAQLGFVVKGRVMMTAPGGMTCVTYAVIPGCTSSLLSCQQHVFSGIDFGLDQTLTLQAQGVASVDVVATSGVIDKRGA